MVAKEVSYSW